MAPGDVFSVETAPDVYYVDTGMYGTAEYGAVYIVDADRPAVVDTGIGTHRDRVFAAIESVGIAVEDLEVIAPTHVHLDHAGGAGFLADSAPEATVYVHEVGSAHLVDPSRLVEGTKRAVGDQWQFYEEPEPVDEAQIETIEGGDVIDLGDRDMEVHYTPGHAPHQVIFHEPDSGWVHTADAAGIWVPSRDFIRETSPPPNFDLGQVLADIDTIRDLDPETLLYAHFGDVTDVVWALDAFEETITNWVEDIEAVYEETGDEEATVQHFVEQNEMESTWGELKAQAETGMNVRGVLHYIKGREH